jgi:hypothetical protein
VATPTKITSSGTLWAMTGSPEQVVDRAANGTLWWFLNEKDDLYPWYSTTEGATWAYAGTDSRTEFSESRFSRANQIDSDGYWHAVGRMSNTGLRYVRNTPGSTGKTWSPKVYDWSPSTEALDPHAGLDMIAFRLGTGWKVFILLGTTRLSGGVYQQTLRLVRLGVSSSGTVTQEASTVIRTADQYGHPYGSLAFQHTGDGKTATATPHVYLVSSINTPPDYGSWRQDDMHLQKLTYEAGNWTLGSPIILESGVDTTNRTMRAAYDGTRVVTVYGTRNRTTGPSSAAIHMADWDEASGVVTRRDPTTGYGLGYPLGTTMAIDPVTDDVYVAAYGWADAPPKWTRYARGSNTWAAWVDVSNMRVNDSVTTPYGHPGRISLKKYVAKSAIEAVFETGLGGNYSVYHTKLTTTNTAPSVPQLRTPAPSSVADLGNVGGVFSWRFVDPDPGDTQGAWQLRRKTTAAGQVYSYYSAATQTWGGAAVWNTGPDQQVSFAPGVFTNGSTWQWSVNTQDTSGLASGFAPDALVVASTAPSVTVTSPAGIYSLDSSPVITWDYSAATPQRTFQVRIFDLAAFGAGGFDPATAVAVWDSGDVASVQARSVRIDTTLLNGNTYRAYLRVSDSNSLYSGWAFSEFLLVLTPAPQPLVEVQQDRHRDTGLARVRLTLQGLTNMLTASQSHDHTTPDDDWENDANCVIATQLGTGSTITGQRSIRLAAVGSGAMRARSAPGIPEVITTDQEVGGVITPDVAPVPRDFAAAPGLTMTAVATFTAATTPRICRLSLRFYRPNDTLATTVTGNGAADLVEFPQQVSVTATAPLGVDRVRLVMEVLDCAAGEVHYVDAVDLHPGASTTWSPGGLTGTQSFTVTRTLPNGTVEQVRTLTGAVASPTQRLVGYDREMPFDTTITYTAQAVSRLTSGQLLASNPSRRAQIAVEAPTWGLRDPLDTDAEVAALVTGHATQIGEQTSVYRPAGRTLPLVETEGIQGEDGTVNIFTRSVAERVRLRNLIRRESPLILQSPSGDRWYIRPISRDTQHETAQSKQFQLEYVEVDPPVGG